MVFLDCLEFQSHDINSKIKTSSKIKSCFQRQKDKNKKGKTFNLFRFNFYWVKQLFINQLSRSACSF